MEHDRINSIDTKKQRKKALLKKRGKSNITFRSIPRKHARYLKDFYSTLMDLNWHWVLLVLFTAMFLCYLTFSILYYLLAYIHGDVGNVHGNSSKPCISNLRTFSDALLFSIETQSTIGYGRIYPSANCPGTIPVIYIQITCGFLLETLLLGFIFMKMARPKHRRHTLIFSDNACLCLEDGQLTLQVRVGDIRNSHLIDCHVYGALVKRYVCQEKYVYPLYQHEIQFEAHGMKNKIFLMWPMVLCHKINKQSPLYSLTPQELQLNHFELILFLQGTIESTGEMLQARSSYTNQEVFWGYRFAQLEEYDDKDESWYINFDHFNKVEKCLTSDLSGQQLVEKTETLVENHTTCPCNNV